MSRQLVSIAYIAFLLIASNASAGGTYQRTKDGRTFVWNSYPKSGDAASWSGNQDSQGYATGYGTLTWYKGNVWVSRYSGNMVRGKLDGLVTNVDANGKRFHGTFVGGSKSYEWTQEVQAGGPGLQSQEFVYQSTPITSYQAEQAALSNSNQTDSLENLLKKADAELTSAYRSCLAGFPGKSKEQLRIAQRAWIVFSDKDEAAAELAGRRRGLTTEDLDREGLNEVNARSQQLRSFFQLPNQDLESCKRDLQQAEQELAVAYQQSLQTLAPDEQEKLREAERSWIEYREKNSRAHISDPTGRAQVSAAVLLARRRTQELQGFYLARLVQASQTSQTLQTQATLSPPPTPFVMLTQPPGPLASAPAATTPPPEMDPAVRAKMIADFKEETKALVADLATETSRFKGFTNFNELPNISVSQSERVSSMAQKARDFQSNIGYKDALRECGTQTTTVDAIVALDRAVRAIKSGDAPSGRFAVTAFLDEHSQVPGDEQKPLWQTLEAVRTLCDTSSKEAATHLERAESLANSGKTAEALKEYESANSIYPDPKIVRSVKKLREESLGL